MHETSSSLVAQRQRPFYKNMKEDIGSQKIIGRKESSEEFFCAGERPQNVTPSLIGEKFPSVWKEGKLAHGLSLVVAQNRGQRASSDQGLLH